MRFCYSARSVVNFLVFAALGHKDALPPLAIYITKLGRLELGLELRPGVFHFVEDTVTTFYSFTSIATSFVPPLSSSDLAALLEVRGTPILVSEGFYSICVH